MLEMREELRDLKVRLGMNSNNSSMPPSSDGLKKPNGDDKPKPKPNSERGKSTTVSSSLSKMGFPNGIFLMKKSFFKVVWSSYLKSIAF